MLSKRLKVIADMVDTSILYDVGCDHALLDIYLSKKNIKCVAIDKSSECLKKAIENVRKNNSKVEVICNNGLENINLLPGHTVVISGMGTKNIMEIIKNKNIEILICQSNKNIYELRKNVCLQGYYICDEKIVLEGKYYIVIKFKRGNKKYNEMDYFLGPILRKNKTQIYIDYLKKINIKIQSNIGKYDLGKRNKYEIFLKMIKSEFE